MRVSPQHLCAHPPLFNIPHPQPHALAEKDPSLIQAPWLLMIEGDYVFLKPVSAPAAESTAISEGFPFFYINPGAFPTLMRPMFPESKGALSVIPPR